MSCCPVEKLHFKDDSSVMHCLQTVGPVSVKLGPGGWGQVDPSDAELDEPC